MLTIVFNSIFTYVDLHNQTHLNFLPSYLGSVMALILIIRVLFLNFEFNLSFDQIFSINLLYP